VFTIVKDDEAIIEEDDDFLDPDCAIESTNMIIIGIQTLYQINPVELTVLLTQTLQMCHGEIDPHVYMNELQKRIIALKQCHDAQTGVSYKI